MKNPLDLEIYDQLARHLAGETSLHEFRNWFDASTWHIEEAGVDRHPLDLAGAVELQLAEFSNGHWTEEELRKNLISLTRVPIRVELSWGQAASRCRTSSASVTVTQSPVILPESSEGVSPTDIRYALEFS